MVIHWNQYQNGVPKVEGTQWMGAEKSSTPPSPHVLIPGLIDSHTHLVFGGDRADEFAWRLEGQTYQEIAAKGGGILKTVTATRKASEEELLELAIPRLRHMLTLGVTTVEIKSGYGLTVEDELKSLRVIQRLKDHTPQNIVSTFMGAHDIPPEYKGDIDGYVDLVCREMIPAVAAEGLADCCDVFCETGYFTLAHTRRILETAQAHGMKLKLHAEEFDCLGSAILGAQMGALSVDHLMAIDDAGIEALKASNTVATLLPGTTFFLRLKDYAPARKLLDAGVTVALATDFNPGSCHINNLQLMMTLGCLQLGMTPEEVLTAVTLNAAKALGLSHQIGSLDVGKQADVVELDLSNIDQWFYNPGVNPVKRVMIKGEWVYHRPE